MGIPPSEKSQNGRNQLVGVQAKQQTPEEGKPRQKTGGREPPKKNPEEGKPLEKTGGSGVPPSEKPNGIIQLVQGSRLNNKPHMVETSRLGSWLNKDHPGDMRATSLTNSSWEWTTWW